MSRRLVTSFMYSYAIAATGRTDGALSWNENNLRRRCSPKIELRPFEMEVGTSVCLPDLRIMCDVTKCSQTFLRSHGKNTNWVLQLDVVQANERKFFQIFIHIFDIFNSFFSVCEKIKLVLRVVPQKPLPTHDFLYAGHQISWAELRTFHGGFKRIPHQGESEGHVIKGGLPTSVGFFQRQRTAQVILVVLQGDPGGLPRKILKF